MLEKSIVFWFTKFFLCIRRTNNNLFWLSNIRKSFSHSAKKIYFSRKMFRTHIAYRSVLEKSFSLSTLWRKICVHHPFLALNFDPIVFDDNECIIFGKCKLINPHPFLLCIILLHTTSPSTYPFNYIANISPKNIVIHFTYS